MLFNNIISSIFSVSIPMDGNNYNDRYSIKKTREA